MLKLNWIEQLAPEQRARWSDCLREPFHHFATIEEELAATPSYWLSRTPDERMEYLEHTRCVLHCEEVVNAKMGEEADPKNTVYF